MGLLKEIEPVQAVKGNTVIEQDRDNEKQLIMPGINMLPHSGNGIAQHMKCHHLVRARLMFDKGVNVARTKRCSHRV
ncbi:hypothetical protein BBM16_08575 [Vibrio parahaemolyticus]|nr:hypothetical protein BBM16_08575 [Vibrio parahaemolyticus]